MRGAAPEAAGHGNAALQSILPPTGSGELLPLGRLDAYTFQDFCCELLGREPGITRAELYGVRGQCQRGVDLKASAAAGGCVLGQCKRVGKMGETALRNATAVFLKHLAYWRRKGVSRFVIFAACTMDTTQEQDEIDRQTSRFRELGVAYEVWHQRHITAKARSTRDLVEHYFGPHGSIWADYIGAPPWLGRGYSPGADRAQQLAVAAMGEQLAQVADDAVSRSLEAIAADSRRGLTGRAGNDLRRLMTSAGWRNASPRIRAAGLQMRGQLILTAPADWKDALPFLEEARVVCPDADVRALAAMIEHARNGPAAALGELQGTATTQTANLRAQLLIELGRLTECEAWLRVFDDALQPDAETHRTRGLLMLARHDVEGAVAALEQAVDMLPDSAAVRFSRVVTLFWSSISPAALPGVLLAVPPPIDWRYVRQDDAAQERLVLALQTIDSLEHSTDSQTIAAEALPHWRLAVLANSVDRQADARALALKLMSGVEICLPAVRWALARGWTDNPAEWATRIAQSVQATDPEYVEAAVQCYLAAHRPEDALAVLAKAEGGGGEGAGDVLCYWRAVCFCESGDVRRAREAADLCSEPTARRSALLAIARREAHEATRPATFTTALERVWEDTGDARYLMELCERHATSAEWCYVADHGGALLSAVRTPAALHLSAVALLCCGQPQDCLDLLAVNATILPNATLPPQFLLVRAAAERALGRVAPALKDARLAASGLASEAAFRELLVVQLFSGDRAGLVQTARQILDAEAVSASVLIGVAQALQAHDSALAARLLSKALALGISDDEVALGLQVACRVLGARDQATVDLMSRATALAGRGQGGLILSSAEGLQAQIARWAAGVADAFHLYESGDVPIHVLAGATGIPVAVLLPTLLAQKGAFERDGDVPPYVRSGRHSSEYLRSCSPKRLILDLPSMLIAELLGILQATEGVFRPVLIPHHTLPALLWARDRMQDGDRILGGEGPVASTPWPKLVDNLIERLRSGVEDGRYELLPDVISPAGDTDVLSGLDLQCLRSLLCCQLADDDLVWSDDRYISSFGRVARAPVASTYELLGILMNHGAISQETLYSGLLALRDSGCLFIPLTPSEIVRIVAGADADKLHVLRRWVAAAFLHAGVLRFSTDRARPDIGEFRAFLDLHRAIEESVVAIWADSAVAPEDRERLATWVLEELYTSALTIRRLTGLPREGEDPLQLEALSVAAFFTHGFLQVRPTEWPRYFRWLDRSLIEPRVGAQPLLSRAVAEQISATLLDKQAWSTWNFGAREKRRIALFIAHLPERLKEPVLEGCEVRDELGFTHTVAVGEHVFASAAFYAALVRVQQAGKARLALLGGGSSVGVRAIGSLPATQFALSRRGVPDMVFSGEELVLLHGSTEIQRQFLEGHRDWYDCSDSEFHRHVDAILADPSPRRRAEAALHRKSSSTAVFYQLLREKLKTEGSFDLRSLLPPDTLSALYYFGLQEVEDGREFADQRNCAAAAMLEVAPLSDVLARFAAVPAPLPTVLEMQLDALEADQRGQLLIECAETMVSPVSRIHLSRLLLRNTVAGEAASRARDFVDQLLSQEGQEEARLLLSLVRWFEAQLGYDRAFRACPLSSRLALPWACAHQLHSAFVDSGGDPTRLTPIFQTGNSGALPADTLDMDVPYFADVSRAGHVTVEGFLIAGSAFALQTTEDWTDAIVGKAAGLLFEASGETVVPRLPFWQDLAGAYDALGFLLSGPWEERLQLLLGHEAARALDGSGNKRIRTSFDALRNGSAAPAQAWATLQAVVGDFPIAAEWQAALRECLIALDLGALVREEPPAGVLAYEFACGQARFLNDAEVVARLEGQVEAIAAQIGEAATTVDSGVLWCFLEAILRLATAGRPPAEAARRLAALVEKAIKRGNRLAALWGPAVAALAERLPLEQGQALWPVLLRIRAMHAPGAQRADLRSSHS